MFSSESLYCGSTWGPFKYYVIIFLTFLGPPSSLMIYSTVNHKKLPFSDPIHPPLWWRNNWMVPYKDETLVMCHTDVFFLICNFLNQFSLILTARFNSINNLRVKKMNKNEIHDSCLSDFAPTMISTVGTLLYSLWCLGVSLGWAAKSQHFYTFGD